MSTKIFHMKYFFIFIFLIAFNITAKSQSAEDSVKAAVNQLFTAMKTSNGALLLSCFADSALLQTITKNKGGEIMVKNESVKDFAASINSVPVGALDERIRFDMIKMDGVLAFVWTPYSFYYNNKFSHCGVNVLLLIRTISGWKIQYIIDTRRKDNCL